MPVQQMIRYKETVIYEVKTAAKQDFFVHRWINLNSFQ